MVYTAWCRLSVCRFMPLGQLVLRVALHLFSLVSLVFLSTVSGLHIYLFNNHHLHVLPRMVLRGEVGCNRFLCPLVLLREAVRELEEE